MLVQVPGPGTVAPPDEYWPRVRELCDRYGILLMADEVQSGFSRTGKMWAVQHWGVEPDIMCMSKAAAGGLPLGICAAKEEVMDWDEGAHENTLGGNPLIMSAALAVLRVIKRERLWENAEKVGTYMHNRLDEMKDAYEIIGDVRGKGLMIGVELVKDKASKAPAEEERDRLIQDAFKKGLLLLGAGPCSVRIAPPLILTMEQAEVGLDIFEGCLKSL